MLLLLLNYIVLRALRKIDVHLISTPVNKSLYYYYMLMVNNIFNFFTKISSLNDSYIMHKTTIVIHVE